MTPHLRLAAVLLTALIGRVFHRRWNRWRFEPAG